MLVRKEGKSDSHTVLLEVYISLSTMESRIEVSKTSKTELPYDLLYHFCGYMQGLYINMPTRPLHITVHYTNSSPLSFEISIGAHQYTYKVTVYIFGLIQWSPVI